MNKLPVTCQRTLLTELGFTETSTANLVISDMQSELISDALSQLLKRDVSPDEFKTALRRNKRAIFMRRSEVFAHEKNQHGVTAVLPDGSCWGRDTNLSEADLATLLENGFADETELMRHTIST